MSKELEALKIGIPKLKKLYENSAKKMNKNDILGFDLTFVYLDKALQHLESIDNANPSDVSLIWLNQRITRLEDDLQHYTMVEKDKALASITEKELNHLTSIKNYILKSQEQEKENTYIQKIKTMMKRKDCILRYIESEDCFAVKTILSDGWYKLTPEFVDNNIREEVEPLTLIEKKIELQNKCQSQEKVLEIIKEKNVSVWGFRNRVFGYQKKQNGNKTINDTYEYYLNNFGCYHNGFDIELLTKEEFELLKRYFNEQNNK